MAHHLTRETSVTTYDNLPAPIGSIAADERSIGGSKLHDIQGVERIARGTAYGASDA